MMVMIMMMMMMEEMAFKMVKVMAMSFLMLRRKRAGRDDNIKERGDIMEEKQGPTS